MLSNLFKKRKLQIFAPVNGDIIPLDQVPDPVFSQKMLGEGIAIMPTTGNIHAPIEGKIVLVADSLHAIGIRSNDGTEILIHIGLETVSLQGKGFTVLVKAGDKVSLGQSLIEVDWDYVREHAESIITPIVITNSKEREVQCSHTMEGIMGETVIMTVSAK
ncbi:PTS sugar transporter subunit IIA [Sporosarcina sp. FSL K6-1508]|uniref:PTS sugar transporter subunit IIA n=1 Tax=Sporosarcina sp. FSL K6-1508 TaxID=2921553 RepID=UPI0030F76A39